MERIIYYEITNYEIFIVFLYKSIKLKIMYVALQFILKYLFFKKIST